MNIKEKFKKIKMEDVYKAIEEKGFYTTPTEKHYDENFIGPKLIVVTDDPDFNVKHPELSEMIIVTSAQFKPMADIYNESMWNDQREFRRYERCTEGYYEDSLEDDNGNCHALKIKNLPLNPVQDEVERRELIKRLSCLREKQRRRVILHYIHGFTYEAIASIENVDKMAIFRSVESALKKIKKILE